MQHLLFRSFLYLSFCVGIASISACQGYDYTINDKVVYRPGPLFTDFAALDPALQACLEQAVSDNAVTTASQLTQLNCSHAGIENLQGLAVFSNLSALRLSSNKIRNLVELTNLAGLSELYLDNNQIVDPVPLFGLDELRYLELSGNDKLQCPSGKSLAHVEFLTLPAHCQ